MYTVSCKDCSDVVVIASALRPLELGDMADHQENRHGRELSQAGDVLRHFNVADRNAEYRAARRQNEVA